MSFINLDSIRKRVADLADSAAEIASQTDQLIADATAAGILDRARTSGEDQLRALFQSFGFTTVILQ